MLKRLQDDLQSAHAMLQGHRQGILRHICSNKLIVDAESRMKWLRYQGYGRQMLTRSMQRQAVPLSGMSP